MFIQLDKTASTAIAKELVENYAGEPVLWKHARYEDFMVIATPEEKKYFIFSGIRNPLDVSVSYYYYCKREHINNKLNLKKYLFISKNNADFVTYFKAFCTKGLYEEWKVKNFKKLDYIYRYENLQKDFSEILKKIGVPQKRPVPVFNKTEGKEENYESYYTKEIQGIARIIFGMFMKKWGYEFPKGWKEASFNEKYFIEPMLYVKFWLESMAHLVVDHPLIYKRFYRIKNTNENSHIS
ncbi:MAG: hypothetical protein NTY04_02350 [Candidatus Staskawiczbacteria bacterium]|nr:hypothetical protein [Candidatus Staskawiczbacteria bacterium]